MKQVLRVIIALSVLLIFSLLPTTTFATETGFLPPTTCVTDGSSCENMQLEDTNYNSWVNTKFENIVVTFTSFGVPDTAIIDDIQIKLRIRTSPLGGWTWFLSASIDSGISYFSPETLCHTLPAPCHYNTTTFFNSIDSPTMTWKNIYPVTGAQINSPTFRLRLSQGLGFKNTDIDTLLFNVRYHTLPPVKIPLILIPGIGGSELKVTEDTVWSEPDGHDGIFTHTYQKDEVVWVNEGEAIKPGSDDYFDILRMKPDGITSEANLELTGNLFAGAYQPTIDFFTDSGYTLGVDLFVFPYDWRRDISHTASLLDERIDDIQQQTGSEKVDIITHSMGGLVARNYITDAIRAQNVRKLFTLAPPHLGAVKSTKALIYGDCLTDSKLEGLPFCLGIPPDEIKDVLSNAISSYELIPTQSYFTFYSGEDDVHPYPFADISDIDNDGVTGPLNYSQTKTLLSNLNNNTSLFDPSEAFHSLDNALPITNGVDVTIIAGSGMPTLGQIVEKYAIDFLGVKIPKKDEVMINGDETVPLFSASLIDLPRNISLLGDAEVYYTKQNHGALITQGPALQLVKNLLEDSSQLPIGVATEPFSFSGTGVSVHSPVDIHVYDAFGNHTGPTPDGFEENIPGSQYDTLDDAKFIFLPEDGVYSIKFKATDNGHFDFIIREFENSTNTTSTLYKNIPLTETTEAETILDTTQDHPPLLSVDQNGDEIPDQAVQATSQVFGDENFDQAPPQTTATLNGTKGTNDWFVSNVEITFDAIDDNSGVAKTEYTVDNGQTIQIYTHPFSLIDDGMYTVKIKSLDKAGNEETPQEMTIKIDKTPPEAKIFIDQDLQDLVVQGIDKNQTTVTKFDNAETNKKDGAIYLITDNAGNTLKLDVRDRDKEKQDRFSIFSLQYNDNAPILLDNNRYNVTYQGKKGKFNVNNQFFEIKGEVRVRIQYNQETNKSTIITKEEKEERIKEVKTGLVILQLKTNNGVLEFDY